jgi:WD40 repeat protein
LEKGRHNEAIDVHYSDSGGTNNMNFSFVTRMSISIPRVPEYPDIGLLHPKFAFSADGSKFATATNHGRVSVWDIQSKRPLKTWEIPKIYNNWPIQHLQFSSGGLRKEALVFAEVCLMFTF